MRQSDSDWLISSISPDETIMLHNPRLPPSPEPGPCPTRTVPENDTDRRGVPPRGACANRRPGRTTRLDQQKKGLLQLAKIRFSRSFSLDVSLRRITRVATRSLNLSRAGVWLFNADRQTLRCRQLHEAETGKHSDGRELTTGAFRQFYRSLETERTIAVTDAAADSRLAELQDSYFGPEGVRGMLCAPIRLDGRLAGAVFLEDREERRWRADEEHFAGSLADLTALALKDAELKRAEGVRRMFAELGRQLNECTSPEMAVRLIGRTAQKLWGWDALFFRLYDPVTERFFPVLNMDTIDGRRVRVPLTRNLCPSRFLKIMEHRKLLLNGPPPPEFTFTRFGNVERPSQSRMFITIRYKQRPLAVLSIQSYSQHAYDQAALDGLEALGEYCTGALVRLRSESLRAESEERFRGLAEATTEGILIHNATRIFDLNPMMSRLFGYRDDQLRTKRLNDLITGLDGGQEMQPCEATGIRSDGSSFPLEVVTRACRYFGKPAKVTVIRDISERKKVEQQLRDHSRQLLEAQENERFRVSRDLHDSVNQVLTAARLSLETLARGLPASAEKSRLNLSRTQDLLARAMEEIRLISWNLRPNELDHAGLPMAIQTLCSDCEERTGISIVCRFPNLPRAIDPEIAVTLFRVVQEALNNACRHSAARRIEIAINIPPQADALKVEISDDGVGFTPGKASRGNGRKGGLGLTNMRERAIAAGGRFELESRPGKGTRLRLTLPLVVSPATLPPKAARHRRAGRRRSGPGLN